MKKNIEKPKLNEDDCRVLSGIVYAIMAGSIRASSLSRKDRKHQDIIHKFLVDMIRDGEWSDALRVEYQNPTFDDTFRMAIERTKGIKEAEFPANDKDWYEKTQLGLMKIAKVYEYMTGKDYATNKKIHQGALDD